MNWLRRWMSWLRRWMRRLPLPSWYSWIVVVLVPIMASMAVLVVSLRVNERSVDRERGARIAAEQARASAEAAFCDLIGVLDDAYRRNPPPTPTGRDVAKAMARMRVAYHCPPSTVPKKK